eukprot:jgi/Mesvir1/25485/Mv25806-RA.1
MVFTFAECLIKCTWPRSIYSSLLLLYSSPRSYIAGLGTWPCVDIGSWRRNNTKYANNDAPSPLEVFHALMGMNKVFTLMPDADIS